MDDVISLTDVGVSDSLTPRLYGHVTSLSNASISDPGKRRERGREGTHRSILRVCFDEALFVLAKVCLLVWGTTCPWKAVRNSN